MDSKNFMLSEDGKVASMHYNNMNEVLAVKLSGHNHRLYSSIKTSSTRGWFGAGMRNFDDVVRSAMYGNDALYDLVKSRMNILRGDPPKINEIEHTVKKRKRKRRWDAQGDELDINRVYSGALDKAWKSTYRIEVDRTHKHIVLLVDIGDRAGCNQVDSLWRAAVCLTIADDLTMAGKNVKIIAGSACHGAVIGKPKLMLTTDFTIKDYYEPLSLERLACMSHVGFHRALNFYARLTSPYRIDSMFGFSNDYLKTTPPNQIKQEGDVKYVYVSRSNSLEDAKRDLASIRKKWTSKEPN